MRRNRYTLSLVILGMVLGIWAAQTYAQTGKGSSKGEKSAAEEAFPWDSGPDTIDVSKYPTEQQGNYKIFVKKCSKCHTLARPINSPYALPEEWAPYVRKMQKKKRSGLDAKSADKIIAFLQFDSSLRKKDLIEKKLKEREAQQKKDGQ